MEGRTCGMMFLYIKRPQPLFPVSDYPNATHFPFWTIWNQTVLPVLALIKRYEKKQRVTMEVSIELQPESQYIQTIQ